MRRDPLYIGLHIPGLAAQALARRDPSLWETAFVTTRQDPLSAQSTTSACAPCAHAAGVRTGMSLHRVRRFGDIRIYREDEGACREALHRVQDICSHYTPWIDTRMFNHAMVLDVCGTRRSMAALHHAPGSILLRRIHAESGLHTASVGVAAQGCAAGLCALGAGDNRICDCRDGSVTETLDRFPVRILPGLSCRTRTRLARMNLRRLGDIRSLSHSFLHACLGPEAAMLWAMVRGIDPGCRCGSGARHTHHIEVRCVFSTNTTDMPFIKAMLHDTVDRFAYRLRRRGVHTRGLRLQLTYGDRHTIHAYYGLRTPGADFRVLLQAAYRLFYTMYTRRISCAALQIRTVKPCAAPAHGQDLFADTHQRTRTRLAHALDAVRIRYGFDAIANGHAHACKRQS